MIYYGKIINLSIGKITDKHQNLLGNSETKIKAFETNWRDNYITNADFVEVKKLGYNVVRIPYHYNMFWNSSTGAVKNDGFFWLDKAVGWAKANGVYVVFCMHAAPGYQNPEHHSDNPGTSVNFWGNNWANVNIAKKVWRHIANRYKNYIGNEWIAGYDLLNEPFLDIQSEKYKLKQAYKEMTSEIRAVDSNHLIFAEGNYYSSDFYDLLERWDSKLVFSNHYYGAQNESNPNPQLELIKGQANDLNIPLWVGEFGENTSNWVKAARTDYDGQNVGWSFWAWKRQDTDRSIYSFNTTSGWNTITNYLKNGGSKPSVTNTESWLNDLITNVKVANCTYISSLQSLLIPSNPLNKVIWLRNNNKYVTSNNGVGPITANRTSLGSWEKFTVVNAGDGKVALKGNNNKYVNSQNGTARMTCNSSTIGGWEAFEWFDINGKTALKGFNGKFVSSEGGSSTGMNCNRETVSSWEAFDWSTTTAGRFANNDTGDEITEIQLEELILYPNPVNEMVSYTINSDIGKHTIKIYDLIGKQVYYGNSSIMNNTIDLSNLTSGNYLLKITTEDGNFSESKYFIKK